MALPLGCALAPSLALAAAFLVRFRAWVRSAGAESGGPLVGDGGRLLLFAPQVGGGQIHPTFQDAKVSVFWALFLYPRNPWVRWTA